MIDILQVESPGNAPRDSEEDFRLLVDYLPGVVYLRRNDAHSSMLYVNNAIESVTGYSREAFLERGITFASLCHPEDRAVYDAEIDLAVAGRYAFQLVYRLRHQSGGWRWVEERGIGVYHEGEPRFVEGFLSDIMERRVAERHLEERRERMQAPLLEAVLSN